jgi:hypothetical protein
MDLSHLFDSLYDGYGLSNSADGHQPISRWLFWTVVIGVMAFFVFFGYSLANSRP